MQNVNSCRSLCLALLALFGTQVGCNRNEVNREVHISVNSWVGFGPLFIAKEAGIFKRHGLDVKITKLENAPDRRAALLSNRVHVLGSTLDDLAVMVSQGVDAVAFASADYSNGSDGIIVVNQITSLKDLLKTSIAVQPGFVNHFFLLYVLDRNNLPTDNLKINPMTPDDAGAAFLSGKIDAAVTWEPFLSEAINKRPGTKILVDTKQYPEAIVDVFVANRTWYDGNPLLVKAFRESWDEGVAYLASRRDSSLLIVAAAIGVPDTAEVAKMMEGIVFLNCTKGEQLLKPNLPQLTTSVNTVWSKAGYISKQVDLTRHVVFD